MRLLNVILLNLGDQKCTCTEEHVFFLAPDAYSLINFLMLTISWYEWMRYVLLMLDGLQKPGLAQLMILLYATESCADYGC